MIDIVCDSKYLDGKMITLLFLGNLGYWGIEDGDSGDVVTYKSFESAEKSFKKIKTTDDLLKEFGWKYQ